VSAGAYTRGGAALPREDTPTYRIHYGRRKCALLQQSPRRLLPGCILLTVRLPRRAVQPLAQPTPRVSVRHDSSATENHNACAVDPTVYAATYTTSTGASPMGREKTPPSVRESTG
jgi:hypothetical protein